MGTGSYLISLLQVSTSYYMVRNVFGQREWFRVSNTKSFQSDEKRSNRAQGVTSNQCPPEETHNERGCVITWRVCGRSQTMRGRKSILHREKRRSLIKYRQIPTTPSRRVDVPLTRVMSCVASVGSRPETVRGFPALAPIMGSKPGVESFLPKTKLHR